MGVRVRETIADQELIFLPSLKRAEEGIAARIKFLAAAPPNYPPIDLEKAATWCQVKTGKQLAPSQLAALRQALSSRVLIIPGGPGVGKTTLVNTILLILRAKKVRCLLCAPTGRAAKRLSDTTGVEAKTIHRLLEVKPASGRLMNFADYARAWEYTETASTAHPFPRCPKHKVEHDQEDPPACCVGLYWQDIEGGLNLLKLLFGRFVVRVHIGMVFAGQIPIGLLNFGRRSGFRYSQDLVVVLSHRAAFVLSRNVSTAMVGVSYCRAREGVSSSRP